MAESGLPAPLTVDYDPITGIPAEFNEYLPQNCDEYKKWKTAQEQGADGAAADIANLTVKAQEPEKQLPGGKKKKHQQPEVVLERNTRNKKKCVTTISGLDSFGIKLSEASKLLGKKFASGASITKSPTDKEQIDLQGDFAEKAADFLLKSYGKDKGLAKKNFYFIDNKKKVAAYPDEE
eukprot:jgi/Astpho2/2264/fgenesh1_pg.00040_%23_84_t